MTRRWAPPTRYTFRRNTASIMKGLVWFGVVILENCFLAYSLPRITRLATNALSLKHILHNVLCNFFFAKLVIYVQKNICEADRRIDKRAFQAIGRDQIPDTLSSRKVQLFCYFGPPLCRGSEMQQPVEAASRWCKQVLIQETLITLVILVATSQEWCPHM